MRPLKKLDADGRITLKWALNTGQMTVDGSNVIQDKDNWKTGVKTVMYCQDP
jgi:hypothetical protein